MSETNRGRFFCMLGLASLVILVLFLEMSSLFEPEDPHGSPELRARAIKARLDAVKPPCDGCKKLCVECKAGESSVAPPYGCTAHCSPAGYCGHSDSFKVIGSVDCTPPKPKTTPGRTLLVPNKASACSAPLFLGGEKYGEKEQSHKDSQSEGGWFVCGDGFANAADHCIVYSMGVNDDWSFDKAASDKYGCEVHGFDPSDAGLASMESYTKGTDKRKYHTWGLGGKDGDYAIGTVPFRWPGIGYLTLSNNMPWALKTVSSTMSALNHVAITVLKMDVEGAEWFAIEDLVNSKIIDHRRALQFAVELHFDPAKYQLREDAASGGFTVTQIEDDDMDYIGLLGTLIDQGLTLWQWKFNSYDHNCVEASFIVKKDGAA